MTYSSCDVHSDIDEALTEAGYELACDEAQGWYWRLGESPNAGATQFYDTEGAATAAAVGSILRCAAELRLAAQEVVSRWDRGDLAEAVRNLDVALQADLPSLGAPDRVPPGELVLNEEGVAIGRVGWLIAGDASDGPWVEDVRLDKAGAIDAAVAIALEWRDNDGLAVDEVAARAALMAHGHFQLHEDMLPSVRVAQVDVIG